MTVHSLHRLQQVNSSSPSADPFWQEANRSTAYFTGSNPHKLALQVAVSGAAYGVDVAEIGDQQKVAEPVIVSPGYREFEFQVIGGKIFHDLSAGSNMWLCK